MTPLCAGAGGTWQAVQAFIAFLATNLFAHVATIHILSGAGRNTSALRVILALFLPAYGGDWAFHFMGRWMMRFQKGQMTLTNAFDGSIFEDAVVSGAVAISVPIGF